tara:strand:+ start:964 stop:1101 length:138 start_codon:yes stop_codon:yes gene_type:complete
MAKKATAESPNSNNKVSRPGIHSKTKTSGNKRSKNYKKAYKGQGR